MKRIFKTSALILTSALIAVSCSHQPSQDRAVASDNCWNSVKTEYHSYFDSVEKCIEKKSDK